MDKGFNRNHLKFWINWGNTSRINSFGSIYLLESNLLYVAVLSVFPLGCFLRSLNLIVTLLS